MKYGPIWPKLPIFSSSHYNRVLLSGRPITRPFHIPILATLVLFPKLNYIIVCFRIINCKCGIIFASLISVFKLFSVTFRNRYYRLNSGIFDNFWFRIGKDTVVEIFRNRKAPLTTPTLAGNNSSKNRWMGRKGSKIVIWRPYFTKFSG